MLTKTKRLLIPATLIAVAASTALAGCNGGAQNIDPAGNKPGASADTGQQDDPSSCTTVADTALQALTKSSTKGKVAVAYAKQTSGGWYVAGPVGDNTSFSNTIGLWATKGDITSDNFGSTFYSLNKDAQTSTRFSAAAPSGFTASSSAAKQALGCAKKAKS